MARRRRNTPSLPPLSSDLSVGEVLRRVRDSQDGEATLDDLLSHPSIDALLAEGRGDDEEDDVDRAWAERGSRRRREPQGGFAKRAPAVRPEGPRAKEDVIAWAERVGGDAFLDDPVDDLAAFVGESSLRTARYELGRDATIRRLLKKKSPVETVSVARLREEIRAGAVSHVLARLEHAALVERRAETLSRPPDGETASQMASSLAALVDRLREHPDALARFSFRRAEMRIDDDANALVVRFSQCGSIWADAVARIGLWPDAPEEMLLDCSCGGGLSAPCPHLRAAAEWARDLVHDPQEPGHRPVLEAISRSPSARTAVVVAEILTRRALGDTSEERIVWRLGERGGIPSLEPVVQKRTARGDWSSGRARAVNALFSDRALAELADEHDMRVLRAIALARLSPGFEEADAIAAAALEALVGHPRVTCADGATSRPIAVVLEAAVLTLVPEGDSFRLCMRMGDELVTAGRSVGARLGERHFVLIDAAVGVCRLARLSGATREALRAIASLPTLLTRLDAIALLDAVAASGAPVDLSVPPSLCEETTRGDPRCRIALSPSGAAPLLEVSLLVRPFGDDISYAPGAGLAEILRGVGGVLTLARRDFSAEVAEAESVASALGLSGMESRGSWRWQTSTMEQSLAVVEAARGLGERVGVEWPRGVDAFRVQKICAQDLRIRVKKRAEWFGIGAEVKVDGVAVSLAALLETVRQKRRYVHLGRGRFAALEEGLRAALASLDDLAHDSEDGELLADTASATVFAGLAADGVFEITGDAAWRRFIARLGELERFEPELPEAFTGALRGYQREGFSWLARLAALGAGACLADDMGLGKTVQTLALLLHRARLGPAVVSAPTSVISGWLSQAKTFAPSLDVRAYHGPTRAKALEKLGKGVVLVTSYDVLASDVEALEAIPFATLIVDEAQMIKNSATQRFRAIARIRAGARVALSGTPVENHLGELWSIFRVLNPGLLGSLASFRTRFAIPAERNGDLDRRRALASLIRPFVLRRTKAAVAPELPPRVETVRAVELTEIERARYEAVRRESIERALSVDPQDPKGRFHVLAAITRLRRLACHPRLDDPSTTAPSAKLAAATELIDDLLSERQRALVFSQFTGHLALLREALDARRRSYLYLDGATPAAERGRLVESWAAGEPSLFLISLKAGGTGLNLMGADVVLHLDPWWNPAVEDQATDRTHRIGQTKPVTVVRLIAADTIEEAVVALHDQKRELARGLLEGTDAAGALSTRELIDLIRRGET